MFKMATLGIFLVSMAIICLTAGPAEGKQLIRLRAGKDCPMPGYYRDEVNCKKFYYCPTPLNSNKPLSIQEQNELAQFITTGIFCPDNSIFDESISACNDLAKVKIVPPECHDITDQSPNWMTNTGLIHEITHN
ncbi:hypothetical protein Ocin01_06253 [Orchesella cincta]|uniref:Chitin-binding type-2 domain-containing protein n=1 Tax=Orchesella cincta TaxID=48709 RepID=A0A1D2N592_ORCCI|nr:hypothetical protein Ocin01_06253 [Orchesella cincta]